MCESQTGNDTHQAWTNACERAPKGDPVGDQRALDPVKAGRCGVRNRTACFPHILSSWCDVFPTFTSVCGPFASTAVLLGEACVRSCCRARARRTLGGFNDSPLSKTHSNESTPWSENATLPGNNNRSRELLLIIIINTFPCAAERPAHRSARKSTR